MSHGVRPRGAPTDRTLPADVFVDRFERRARVTILGTGRYDLTGSLLPRSARFEVGTR
jgi:hypothetical protein